MDASSHIAVDENSIRYDGWRVVGACFLVAIFGWGLCFYGQSVFLAELHRIHGWSTSLISAATTLFYLFSAVLVAFVSDVIRRLGSRICFVAGVCCLALSTAALGRIDALWQLYAVYGLMAFGWAGVSLAAITNTLGLWFTARRGMAISLALNGASCGGVFGVPILTAAIGSLGLATALSVTAVVTIAVLVPVIVIAIGRPPHRSMSDGNGVPLIAVPVAHSRRCSPQLRVLDDHYFLCDGAIGPGRLYRSPDFISGPGGRPREGCYCGRPDDSDGSRGSRPVQHRD
jgi:MFS family permease